MKFFTKEVKIALTAIVAIVVLFYGLQFLKGLTVFSNDDSYYVTFTDVSGLSASSPVYANGYKVGVVKDIIYDYSPEGKIVAVMGLDKNMRVPQGTRAEIASDLLGNIKVNLVLGKDPLHMLAGGDTISGSAEEGMMSKIGAMMPAIEAIIPKLDSIMTSLNILLADPALRNTLHNVEGMTGNLNSTSQNLKALSASLNRDVPGMMTKANTHLSISCPYGELYIKPSISCSILKMMMSLVTNYPGGSKKPRKVRLNTGLTRKSSMSATLMPFMTIWWSNQ